MIFSVKLDKFRSGSLFSSSSYLEKPELHDVNLKNNKRGRILFEKGVRLDSQVIAYPNYVFIGAYSYMNSGGYVRGNTFIGRYCSIGRRVTLGAGMHNMQGLTTFPIKSTYKSRRYSPVELESVSASAARGATVIENDVWIGDGVVVLPGVRVGAGAVIGANSVVVKDVPAFSIVGGVPAKLLKMRFSDNVCDELLRSNWWEFDLDQLQSMPVRNVFEFLEFIAVGDQGFFKFATYV